MFGLFYHYLFPSLYPLKFAGTENFVFIAVKSHYSLKNSTEMRNISASDNLNFQLVMFGDICSESFIIITRHGWGETFSVCFVENSFYFPCLARVYPVIRSHLLFFSFMEFTNTKHSIISCFDLYKCGSISFITYIHVRYLRPYFSQSIWIELTNWPFHRIKTRR